jgi:hypothetical protein
MTWRPTVVEVAREPERAKELVNNLLAQWPEHERWIMEATDDNESIEAETEQAFTEAGALVLPAIGDNIALADYVGKWQMGVHASSYHRDKSALNHSGLKKAIIEPDKTYSPTISPAHFFAYWCGQAKPDEEQTKAQHIGTLFHMATLEPDRYSDIVRVMPAFGDLRKKEPKAAKAEWLQTLAPDHVVCKAADDQQVRAMAASVRAFPMAANLLREGIAESTGYFVDPQTHMLCRIRPDFLNTGSVIVDLKSTKCANPLTFDRTVIGFGYDTQAAFYKRGAKAIDGEDRNFAIIACEKEPPFAVSVNALDTELLFRAEELVSRALDAVVNCCLSGKWSAYPETANLIGLPAWLRKQSGSI